MAELADIPNEFIRNELDEFVERRGAEGGVETDY